MIYIRHAGGYWFAFHHWRLGRWRSYFICLSNVQKPAHTQPIVLNSVYTACIIYVLSRCWLLLWGNAVAREKNLSEWMAGWLAWLNIRDWANGNAICMCINNRVKFCNTGTCPSHWREWYCVVYVYLIVIYCKYSCTVFGHRCGPCQKRSNGGEGLICSVGAWANAIFFYAFCAIYLRVYFAKTDTWPEWQHYLYLYCVFYFVFNLQTWDTVVACGKKY